MRTLRKEAASLMILLLIYTILTAQFQLSSAFAIQNSAIGRAFGIASPRTTPNVFQSAASNTDEDIAEVLGVLEKKLKGESLTEEEIRAAVVASDSLLEDLDHPGSEPLSGFGQDDLRAATARLDVDAVSTMIDLGLEMDVETTDVAYWAVVNEVDRAEAEDLPLSTNVTSMIHHIFDADLQHLLVREKQTTNVTCMQPDDSTGLEGAARKMNYVFDDGDHKNLPLTEGRRCEGGNCCDACSRNIFPTFASHEETSLTTFPELARLTFNDLEKVSAATIIQFVRLIERVRRTISHEYGVPLSTLLPLQAYSRKYVAGTTQKGGGGGEGDFVTLHTDEATHSGYHYSCVLYLSTQGEDFEGGNFVFNDPAKDAMSAQEIAASADIKEYSDGVDEKLLESLRNGELPDELILGVDDEDNESSMSLEEEIRRAGRELTPFHPTRGAAAIFSSGWENMHEVEKITSGVRYAVPCFFTTCPVPDAAYEQMMVGKPKTEVDIADDWLHLLLAHRNEEPMQSVGRVKELLMKWHNICTPLGEH